MISRITEKFAALKKQARPGLVTFIMGGDPGVAQSLAILKALPGAGADVIEIGMPFSDPMADGPTIQAAGIRALKAKTKLADILHMVVDFRAEDGSTPIILMGYYNPICHYGIERFCADAVKVGVDGLIIVDIPPEEEDEFKPYAEKAGLALIRLVAPTSLNDRLPLLLRSTQGFVYYISVTGITGAKSADTSVLKSQVEKIKSQTALPVAVGFGVKTPAQAAEIGQYADAVVVGSALVDIIAKAQDAPKEAAAFVQSLAEALKK